MEPRVLPVDDQIGTNAWKTPDTRVSAGERHYIDVRDGKLLPVYVADTSASGAAVCTNVIDWDEEPETNPPTVADFISWAQTHTKRLVARVP